MLMNIRKVQGFTLLEIMIALFVLSVGMLGASALVIRGQTEAVKVNYDAVASQMAVSVAEMMRSNIDGVVAGEYDNLDSHAADPGCIATGCDAAGLAAYDSAIWGWMLDEYLPSGAVGTVRGGGADSVFTITVSWQEAQRTGKDTGALVTRNYVMVFQP